MRKFLLLFLTIVAAFSSSARDFTYEGVVYTVISEDERTVETKVGSLGSEEAPAYSGNNLSGDVVLPATVYDEATPYSLVSLGEGSFINCTALTSVELPSSLTSIGDGAFNSCSSLTSVEFPASLTSIGDGAFAICVSLTSLQLSSSLTSIGNYAFQDCIRLTSVDFPASLTSLGECAFLRCTELRSVKLPDSLTSFGMGAFCCCYALTSVVLPSSLTSINMVAFQYCSNLASIEFPTTLTSIEFGAFEGCSSLTSIDLSSCESLTYIGGNSFRWCTGLTSIKLPSTLTNIDAQAFLGCTGLTTVELPADLTSLGNGVFSGCSSLTSVEFPASLTSLNSDVFYRCSALTSIELPSGLTGIGSSAFRECTGLLSIGFSPSLTIIESEAFRGCTALTSVELPASLTTLGDGAFAFCSGLKAIELPASLTRIGPSAFTGSGLKSVTFSDMTEPVEAGDFIFGDCDIKAVNSSSVAAPEFVLNNPLTYVTPENSTVLIPTSSYSSYSLSNNWSFLFENRNPIEITVGEEAQVTYISESDYEEIVANREADAASYEYFVAARNGYGSVADGMSLYRQSDYAVRFFIDTEADCSVLLDGRDITSEIEDGMFVVAASADASRLEIGVKGTGGDETSVFGPEADAMADVQADVYTLTGVCVLRQARAADLSSLAPGIYIFGGRKICIR